MLFFMRNWLMVLILAATAALPALAQAPRSEKYSNKLAPYVPSPQTAVDRMLEMAHLKPGEIEVTMQEIKECAGAYGPRMLENNQVFEL